MTLSITTHFPSSCFSTELILPLPGNDSRHGHCLSPEECDERDNWSSYQMALELQTSTLRTPARASKKYCAEWTDKNSSGERQESDTQSRKMKAGKNFTLSRQGQTTRKGGTQSHWPKSRKRYGNRAAGKLH
jgi:hypothetical protein